MADPKHGVEIEPTGRSPSGERDVHPPSGPSDGGQCDKGPRSPYRTWATMVARGAIELGTLLVRSERMGGVAMALCLVGMLGHASKGPLPPEVDTERSLIA